MQNYQKNEAPLAKVFITKLEDIPGGVTVAVKDLNATRVYAGTPLGMDDNGLCHVVKTAKVVATAASDATTYQVAKGHNFKVGDVLASGSKGYLISAIDQSSSDYDVLTVGTTLGAATIGAVLYEGSKAAASGVTFRYAPKCLVGTTFDVIAGDNHLVDGIVRGTVIEANIENAPISDAIKTAMPHIIFN